MQSYETTSQVGKFVRDNIFWITQGEYHRIYFELSDPTDKILFAKYIPE